VKRKQSGERIVPESKFSHAPSDMPERTRERLSRRPVTFTEELASTLQSQMPKPVVGFGVLTKEGNGHETLNRHSCHLADVVGRDRLCAKWFAERPGFNDWRSRGQFCHP
jgi:hypothetical protein